MAVRSSAEDRAIQVSRSDTCISRCIYTVNRKCKYVYSRQGVFAPTYTSTCTRRWGVHARKRERERERVCVCARSWSQAAETVYIRQVDARASCKRAGAFWIILFIFRHALAGYGVYRQAETSKARFGKDFETGATPWCCFRCRASVSFYLVHGNFPQTQTSIPDNPNETRFMPFA